MIILTGGAGFIGSVVLWRLNCEKIEDILIVDELESSEKWRNLVGKRFSNYLHKDEFRAQLRGKKLPDAIEAVIHLGACSSTTESNIDYLLENNYHFSCELAEWALAKNARFIYASSAATYGDGSLGFSDTDSTTPKLRPLNGYGFSKQLTDQRFLDQKLFNQIVGLKFFNVFGPNEYHKGEMRSVVVKAFEQVSTTGSVRLFKSYCPEYAAGEQSRDFIYVKDCADVIYWLLQNPRINGLFNLGTGVARTWNDLARAVFSACNQKERIDYIDMPAELRGKYQYHTQAQMEKFRSAGLSYTFTTLEDAVRDYVQNYLAQENRYL